MIVMTAAQNNAGRRPMISVTLPQVKPAKQPPIQSAAVWRDNVAVSRLK
jgi:hypothetical protein